MTLNVHGSKFQLSAFSGSSPCLVQGEFTSDQAQRAIGFRYELLFAGSASTEAASKALPALSGIAAFPSTIFIDKKGNVRKIHTGFSGPATGKFYQEFKDEFNGFVNELVAEN